MRLLGDRILCKPIEVKQENTGGLILPASMAEQNQFEVVMIGPKVNHLKVGDRISLFKNSNKVQIDFNELECVIVNEGCDVELLL